MNRFIAYIKNQFQGDTRPERLDAFRIIFAMTAGYLLLSFNWTFYADTPACVFEPPGLADLFLKNPLSKSEIQLFASLLAVSVFTLMLGLFSRFSALLAGLCLAVLSANTGAAYYFDRSVNPALLVFFVLAAAPSLGSYYSLDRIFLKNRMTYTDGAGWPVRLIQFLFFFTFFAAGCSKLLNSGVAWLDENNIMAKWVWASETFQAYAQFNFQKTIHAYFVNNPGWASPLGFCVLALELSSLLFFLFKPLRHFGVAALALLQFSIFCIMYIPFTFFIPLYLIFIPSEMFFNKIIVPSEAST